MQEIGRGVPAFEAAPVQGRLVPVDGDPAGDGAAGDGGAGPAGVVVLVDDPGGDLPGVESLVAVVCTAGGGDDPLADAARAAGVPCVLGVTFDGGPPPPGTLALVDCSKGGEGIVEVVDGGATSG